MKKYIPVLILSFVFILAACGNKVETNMESAVPDFEYTTQDESTLSNTDLEGKYWVADFVFTNCTTVCLPMTSNMASLQEKIAEANLDNVHLVSFTVDPETDSPEVLKEYAEEYGADLTNWTFLTGYDFETIKEFSIKNFKNIVEAPLEGDDQVTHGTHFFLVNPEGEIIKNYSGLESDGMDKIVEDLENLQ